LQDDLGPRDSVVHSGPGFLERESCALLSSTTIQRPELP
jgi:hypothetical protein